MLPCYCEEVQKHLAVGCAVSKGKQIEGQEQCHCSGVVVSSRAMSVWTFEDLIRLQGEAVTAAAHVIYAEISDV